MSVVRAIVGSGGRFSMIGCMNSTDRWIASQELPPLPIANSRPPASNRPAIAWQQATIFRRSQ